MPTIYHVGGKVYVRPVVEIETINIDVSVHKNLKPEPKPRPRPPAKGLTRLQDNSLTAPAHSPNFPERR